jgi:hypothetical protein
MPLLRSRTRVHRARLRFGIAFYLVIALWTLGFAAILAGHYLLIWWWGE